MVRYRCITDQCYIDRCCNIDCTSIATASIDTTITNTFEDNLITRSTGSNTGAASVLESFSLYGQVVIDEFSFSEIKNRTGWWANKQGYQVGLKYIDVANVSNLDAQIEWNEFLNLQKDLFE